MKALITIMAILIMTLSSTAYAEKGYIIDKIERVMIHGSAFGSCMVKFAVVVGENSSKPLDCPSSWVSLSCSGDFNSKDIAYRMYDNAQMSLALNKRVAVYIDDTKKHNGYCVAYQVNVYK